MKTFAKLVVGTVGVILSFGVIEAKMPRSASAASLYTITDLGTLGGTQSYARGINNSGQVVGYSDLPGDQTIHAFRTAPNSPINPATDDLGTLNGSSSFAYGINNLGQVVGGSGFSAFRTAPNSPVNPATDDLGSGTAYGINDSGQVVGVNGLTGFRTAPNSPINPATDNLNNKSTFFTVLPYGINNSGEVAATAYNLCCRGTQAIVFNDISSPYNISPFPFGRGVSYAYGINDLGQAVGYGYSYNPPSDEFAFLYDGRSTRIIGPGVARAINNSTQVVGQSNGSAFLYEDSTLYDLNNLIAPTSVGIFNSLTGAYGINDKGQIVGDGLIGNTVHAFLATPVVTKSVPEPSATPEELILGLGMVGGWLYRKRLAAKSLSSN